MDEAPAVSEAFDRSSAAIRVGQLQGLLRAQVHLYEEAQLEARGTRQAVIRLIEGCVPGEIDRHLVDGQPLGALSTLQLLGLLERELGGPTKGGDGHHPALSARIGAVASDEREELSRKVRSLTEKAQELSARVESLQNDLDASREQNRMLLEERKALGRRLVPEVVGPAGLIAETQPSAEIAVGKAEGETPIPPALGEPDWLVEWRNDRNFERESRAIIMLGDTGLSRRPAILSSLAAMLGVKVTTNSLRLLMGRLQERNMIEVLQALAGTGCPSGGRLPDLLQLSERGRLAYWALNGRDAHTPEIDLLIKRCGSAQSALLLLAASDALREAGYVEVHHDDEPSVAEFRPDLLFRGSSGEILNVMVLGSENKIQDWDAADKRWRDLSAQTGDDLYVMCEDLATMRAARNQIHHALGTARFALHLANLADLRAGRRGVKGSIWLVAKTKPGARDGGDPV